MNAEKLPTLPPTTMSPPFSEMPQRSDASPVDHQQSAVRRGAGRRRGEALDARRVPDIMFSAPPGPALPCTVMFACLFMPPT